MRRARKRDFPVADVRRFLEPGPIVLVSSAYKDETNIMTMGWHTVLEFVPSLVGCMITAANHSHDLIRRSKECVINLPTVDLAEKVVRIGNCSGRDVEKFVEFELTPAKGARVKAHVARTPKVPRTIHYRGEGQFMISGEETRRFRRLLRPQNL